MRQVGMGAKIATPQAVAYEVHMEAVNEIVQLQELSTGLKAENEALKAENEAGTKK